MASVFEELPVSAGSDTPINEKLPEAVEDICTGYHGGNGHLCGMGQEQERPAGKLSERKGALLSLRINKYLQ